MQQTPFHAYTMARTLDSLPDENRFFSVFASSDIRVYPFQIAAARFALRSPYQKGVVLCDESGLGKSHEAMLVITQRWLEGKRRILLAVPNADLLYQWVELIQTQYTIPYVVLAGREDWEQNVSDKCPNAFIQDALVLTTYDFLANRQAAAREVKWELIVFEEATALSSVYEEDGRQAAALKAIADGSFKLLLTGTPIEKNIMDLYGLLYFIDETILPDPDTYMKRYLRRPENYPELSERVSRYCFRTLRRQAEQYAKLPRRIPVTLEYAPSEKERELYDLLFAYINKPDKRAFPEMEPYDLALRLLGLLSSSTAAIRQTIGGIIKRLEAMPDAREELAEFRRMEAVAGSVGTDEKACHLLRVLKGVFPVLKSLGANRKVVIFTESVETQKMLLSLLKDTYKCGVYNGSADYSAMQWFQAEGEILLSTDHGARGFNLEATACVVHYDLLFNTLKMEQRIDRCHRLNQQNDVVTIAFIDKHNFADVRKLELVNKRLLVSDGVFGVSDAVVGGFTDSLEPALEELKSRARTKEQVEAGYRQTLAAHEAENKQTVASAEDILFTTFTGELSRKVTVTPQYVEEQAKALNDRLWELSKFFFQRYNETHEDCFFEIDDAARTVTATRYETLPCLFYYWSGSGSRKYRSQKRYGMAADFNPRHGRITLTSILGQGILHELECADSGALVMEADIQPCTIALYTVELQPSGREVPLLTGKTASGTILSDEQCREILRLPVVRYTESEHKAPHWLRTSSGYHELDRAIPTDRLLEQESAALSPAQAEEVDRMKLRAKTGKSALSRALGELEQQVKAAEQELRNVSGDRMQTLALSRKLSLLQRELGQKKETQFFEEMQLELELEKQIEAFLRKQKTTAKAVRQFVIEVEGRK